MITIKIRKAIVPLCAVIASLYFMFAKPYSVADGITEGLKICFYTVLPSLFPFMVLASYIVKSDIFSPVYKAIAPVTKLLFKQPPCTVGVIVMSLIGGFPIGAKMTASLLERGQITKNQAQRLNGFCINCGPAFAVTAVGAAMYRSRRAGIIIYLSLCISSAVLGTASSFFDDGEVSAAPSRSIGQSPLAALSSSVAESVQSVLGICAWIVLFSALTGCIEAAEINEAVYKTLACVLEVTKGCTLAAGYFPITVVAAVIGFGGFCVHCQIYPYIRLSGLKYKHFFVSRAVNSALSALICQAILIKFPIDINTAAMPEVTPITYSVSLPAFFALAVMCIVMIFDIDAKKKMW